MLPATEGPSASYQTIQDANPTKFINKGIQPRIPKKIMNPKSPFYNLILETGMERQLDGKYVLEEEAKLTPIEEKAKNNYVRRMTVHNPRFLKLTEKIQKNRTFRLRKVWLLNKETMMRNVNQVKLAQQLSREAKKESKQRCYAQHLQKVKRKKGATTEESTDIDQGGEEQYYDEDEEIEFNLTGEQHKYQYLGMNDNKARKKAAKLISYPGYTGSTLNTSNVYQTYPENDYSFFPAPAPSSLSSFNPFGQTSPSSALTTAFGIPPPTTYSSHQQSSTYSPIVQSISSQPTAGFTNPYSQLASNFSTSSFDSSAPVSPVPTQVALEVSEQELSRQKRLMEIEEELKAINGRKLQIQMEAEIKQAEAELAQKQQMMEIRERELRDREYFEIGRRSQLEQNSYASQYCGRSDYSNHHSSYHDSHHPQDDFYYQDGRPMKANKNPNSFGSRRRGRHHSGQNFDVDEHEYYDDDHGAREGSSSWNRPVDSHHYQGKIKPAFPKKSRGGNKKYPKNQYQHGGMEYD
ncbi:Nuclear transcription factor Y subunit [Caenorhabditis elegans]|uniref:Nuclear transcription factor Y subunit n=1 Tax=Caenorhabditis elegans TaxID=6239 RepID=H2KZP4_CAEEL|nr:Nuclear transcription factor Y subunit [Caenorhabditis elegans]CCD69070.2 Nuclear transcription factor Y subunit [Caenorhabditis elegans]|eukprot:NP_001021245.2 Uncharacterized protein CELE_F08F8.10 [Caenorhabditis elegans]